MLLHGACIRPCPQPNQVDGRPGRAALMLAARRLRAMEAQARMRVAVEKEQTDIAAMNDRSYRKFARQCQRQRADTLKAVRETPDNAHTSTCAGHWHAVRELAHDRSEFPG